MSDLAGKQDDGSVAIKVEGKSTTNDGEEKKLKLKGRKWQSSIILSTLAMLKCKTRFQRQKINGKVKKNKKSRKCL